jgi:WhiB family transcriptional regulator, redox-sensing transcriptional regulator
MTVHASWREAAACRDADPELFFPVGTAGPALRQVEEAKRICRICPAQAPCLAWALDHGVRSGVWGGATEDERRAVETRIGRALVAGDVGDGAAIRVDLADGELAVTYENPA